MNTTILPPAPWTTRDDLAHLVAALDPDGAGLCRYVGGAVRDTLLGLDVKDIEMATLTQSVHDLEAAAAQQAAAVEALQARNEAAVASWRSKLVRRAPSENGSGQPAMERGKARGELLTRKILFDNVGNNI